MTNYFRTLTHVLASITLIAGLLIAPTVFAKDPKLTIRDDGYHAKYVSQTIPDPIIMKAGETKTVDITFKNVGTKTWTRGGKHISAYTEVPRDRKSAFATSQWVSPVQTALIQPRTIAPGQTGTLTIDLKAPTTPGEYTEEFHLAAENTTWVKGGYFFLKIVVQANEKAPATPTPSEPSDDLEEENNEEEQPTLKARKALLSKKQVNVKGGEKVKLVVGFQNIGNQDWEKYALIANRPALAAATDQLTFADQSWTSHSVILEKEKDIAPKGLFRENIFFRAPRERGIHTFTISPMVNGEVLAASVDIEVTVTQDAPDHFQEPNFDTNKEVKQKEPRLKREPKIRVGVAKNPVELGEAFRFRYLDDQVIVYDGDLPRGVLKEKVMGAITANTNGTYSFKGGDIEFTTNQYVRVVPKNNQHATFLTLNYSRRVKWRGATDFNIYRGSLEYRKTVDGHDNYYFINEILFEDYVAGIAEASNLDPEEFLKAQAIAARTYAYYIQQKSNKHEERFFDVVATTGDQLYLGYNNEVITPNYVAATKATRGEFVTYNDDFVITPYFGHSNGTTRSWTSVWGGSHKPWLVPVSAEYDLGRTRFGHGVGMSQRDAALRAKKEGKTYNQLIKHYYTGTELEQFYK